MHLAVYWPDFLTNLYDRAEGADLKSIEKNMNKFFKGLISLDYVNILAKCPLNCVIYPKDPLCP